MIYITYLPLKNDSTTSKTIRPVTPPIGQGVFLLVGYNSDEIVTYGVGYKCSDNMKVVSEFTSGTDSDGNDIENDFAIRASYSF